MHVKGSQKVKEEERVGNDYLRKGFWDLAEGRRGWDLWMRLSWQEKDPRNSKEVTMNKIWI